MGSRESDIRAIASPALMARGLVNVIGYDAIEAHLGLRWIKLHDGVRARLDAMLRQRLGPDDVFIPLNDTAFLVTTPTMETDEAQIVCLRIAHELYSEYLGSFEIGLIKLFAVIPAEGNGLALEQLPVEQIFVAAERAGIADAIVRLRKAQAPRGATPDLEFHPMWDTRKEAIAGYMCVSRAAQNRDPEIPIPVKERLALELDTLYTGVTKLADSLEQQERFLIGFGLGFDTLGSALGRVEFVSVCRELPPEFRPYTILILTGIPSGIPQSRLADLLMTVRPFCKAVFAEASSHTRIYAPFSGIGLQGVGHAIARNTPPRTQRADIHRLGVSARRNNLATFLTGVDSRIALQAAREARINILAGPAISPALETPTALKRLTWQNVLGATATAAE